MKYISLNIWLGGKLWKPLVEFLKKEKPDILAIQEAQRAPGHSLEPRFNTVYELAKALGYAHTTFAPLRLIHFSEKRHVQSGNAILSHFPILRSEVTSFDIPYGEVNYDELVALKDFSSVPAGVQHAVIDVRGAKVNILNVHGIWGKDGFDSPRRQAMGQTLEKMIDDKVRVIMSGDFNMDGNSETVRKLEQRLAYVLKDKAPSTFNVKQKGDPKWGNFIVDLLFAGPDVRVREARVMSEADVSDHLPLMMEFDV